MSHVSLGEDHVDKKKGKRTSGLLVHRRGQGGELEYLLVHPGGPIWAKRDEGAWSIPKGLNEDGEESLETALREFREETGLEPPESGFVHLGAFAQPSGKIVDAWAAPGDYDASSVHSNVFEMEWPPRSGQKREYPEIDRAEWFRREEAERRILPGQRAIIEAVGRHAEEVEPR